MASDWAVVVGTGIGAASGVVTLLVGRRFDAHDRKDDRTWGITQQNIEQRREVFAKIVRYSAAYHQQMEWVVGIIDASDDVPEEVLDIATEKARELLGSFTDVAAEVDVIAVDPTIGDLCRELIEAGYDFQLAVRVDAYARFQPQIDDVERLMLQLRRVCRRDLELRPHT